jgi:nucleobase:cation symporter-1, NCS1 family
VATFHVLVNFYPAVGATLPPLGLAAALQLLLGKLAGRDRRSRTA